MGKQGGKLGHVQRAGCFFQLAVFEVHGRQHPGDIPAVHGGENLHVAQCDATQLKDLTQLALHDFSGIAGAFHQRVGHVEVERTGGFTAGNGTGAYIQIQQKLQLQPPPGARRLQALPGRFIVDYAQIHAIGRVVAVDPVDPATEGHLAAIT